MDDQTIRAALERHWAASDASDFAVEHEIYREDAVLDYPQSGERIRGRRNIQESRRVQPNTKRFTVRRMIGRCWRQVVVRRKPLTVMVARKPVTGASSK